MNPYFVISTYSIPTWITPLVMLVCVSALIPSTSFLGHLCGLSVGYLCECNWLPCPTLVAHRSLPLSLPLPKNSYFFFFFLYSSLSFSPHEIANHSCSC